MSVFANSTIFLKEITTDKTLLWNSLVSKDLRMAVEFVFYTGLSSLVCLVGIPTNILNCWVFWHQGLKDRMNICLFSLAIVDCCYLSLEFVMYPVGSFIVVFNNSLGNKYQTQIISNLFGASSGFRSTSRFIGVIIAVERCVCLVVPLIASTIMRPKTVTITIIVACLLFQTFCAFIPLSFEAQPILVEGEIFWMFSDTDFQINNRRFVYTLIYTVLGFIVPVTFQFIVTAATVITIVKLRAAMTWRRKSSSTASDSVKHQESLTVMLVIVSLIHIVTNTPSVAWELALYFTADLFAPPSYWELLKLVSAVANVFPEINSAVNFFVYYLRSSRFRSILHQLSRKSDLQASASFSRKGLVIGKKLWTKTSCHVTLRNAKLVFFIDIIIIKLAERKTTVIQNP